MFSNSDEPRENWPHSKIHYFVWKIHYKGCVEFFGQKFRSWQIRIFIFYDQCLHYIFANMHSCKALFFVFTVSWIKIYIQKSLMLAPILTERWYLLRKPLLLIFCSKDYAGISLKAFTKLVTSFWFTASILNAEKISDLLVHFVIPQTWMCERKYFEITNLYRNWTCSKLMQRWRASTGILN